MSYVIFSLWLLTLARYAGRIWLWRYWRIFCYKGRRWQQVKKAISFLRPGSYSDMPQLSQHLVQSYCNFSLSSVGNSGVVFGRHFLSVFTTTHMVFYGICDKASWPTYWQVDGSVNRNANYTVLFCCIQLARTFQFCYPCEIACKEWLAALNVT
jgi:hypothetical protein